MKKKFNILFIIVVMLILFQADRASAARLEMVVPGLESPIVVDIIYPDDLWSTLATGVYVTYEGLSTRKVILDGGVRGYDAGTIVLYSNQKGDFDSPLTFENSGLGVASYIDSDGSTQYVIYSEYDRNGDPIGQDRINELQEKYAEFTVVAKSESIDIPPAYEFQYNVNGARVTLNVYKNGSGAVTFGDTVLTYPSGTFNTTSTSLDDLTKILGDDAPQPGGSSGGSNSSGGAFSDCGIISPIIQNIITNYLNFFRIAAIIILVIFGMMDFAKAALANDEKEMKKAQETFVKRCIIAVAIILAPIIVSSIMTIINESNPGFSMERCGF